jgi:sugar-specific transcriptional regulator TrmB
MDTAILRKAGLTESQAKGYLALIEHGALAPADLAVKISESRTNGYAVADKLVEYGLATKKDKPHLVYTATHPSALESLAERRRKVLVKNEQEVKNNISGLIDMFYTMSEQPGARTLQGVDGIKEVYEDTIRTGADIYLLRTPADLFSLGREYMDTYRARRSEAGIATYALTPATEKAIEIYQSGVDPGLRFYRTFFLPLMYDAAVEIDVYGDKVALISFGETQMATIIQSPIIAEAMRQILRLIASLLPPNDETVRQAADVLNQAP